MSILIRQASPESLQIAAQRLRAGQLVAFPTETVYGLGADARCDQAVAQIFAAKNRPAINPLIVHVASAKQAAQLVDFDDRAQRLAAQFWPGPLTLVLPARAGGGVSSLVSAGLPTLAIRVPAHPVAQALLKEAAVPIAAPSANASGTLSPTSAQHVAKSLGDKAGMILAAGRAAVGLESTVLDLSDAQARLLRPGAVTLEDLRDLLGDVALSLHPEQGQVRSPGQLLQHYAPRTPLRLNAVDVKKGEALLAFGSLRFMACQETGFARDLPEERLQNLSATGDLLEASSNLFDMLHKLDSAGATAIAVMPLPKIGLGLALNDRLSRAAGDML